MSKLSKKQRIAILEYELKHPIWTKVLSFVATVWAWVLISLVVLVPIWLLISLIRSIFGI
jgi:hypothetical protein